MITPRRPLADYLAIPYRFNVIAGDPGERGYVIEFPDLPGCMTSIESLEELVPMANEIRELWIETEYECGAEIPEPSYPETYSGKFNVRLPKSLHRLLAWQANDDGVSLNQYVVALLAAGTASRTGVFSNGRGYPASSIEPSSDGNAVEHAREVMAVAS